MKQSLKEQVRDVVLETLNERAQFAKGYKAGYENYEQDNLVQDFTGWPASYVKGYEQGVKDGRKGKFNNWIKNFLLSLGNVLSLGKLGNRTGGDKDVKWKS